MLKINCQDPWFSYIKQGIKTIEGRKASPKYAALKPGDVVAFHNDGEEFQAEVVKVDSYSNLREYVENNDLGNILPGIKTVEEGINLYRSLVDDEELSKYGFLGIHVKLI